MGSYNIPIDDIMFHFKYKHNKKNHIDALNQLVSSTNKVYRIINNIQDPKIKLLKKVNRTGFYEVLKDFKPNKHFT